MPNPRLDFNFQDEPNENDTGFPWTVVRTPASNHLDLICVSAKHTGVRTHYFRGRTIGCSRSKCEACDSGNISRWSGYLLAVANKTGQRVLFEFTPTAQKYLKALYETHPSLRGMRLRAHRPSKRANGTIVLQAFGFVPSPSDLPEEVPIRPLLFHIWGVAVDAGDSAAAAADDGFTEHETNTARGRKPRGRGKVEPIAETLSDLPGQMRLLG